MLSAAPGFAQPRRSVALTFDDLPGAGSMSRVDAEAANRRILGALKRHRARAVGFVMEQRGEAIGPAPFERILEAWLNGGHELGNHTYSHLDFNDLSEPAFEQEVIRGEATLRKVLAKRQRAARYFRFPFNHTGDPSEKAAAGADFLRKRGYTAAAFTIDTSDWQFARAYDAALERHAAPDAAKLRRAYVDYSAAEIDYYAGLHRQVFGKEIPQIMLLHVNRLNADSIDDILRLFEQRGYRFVTLDEAQAHPAYRTPVSASKFGQAWGYRWARELGVKVDGKLEPEPPAWVAEYR